MLACEDTPLRWLQKYDRVYASERRRVFKGVKQLSIAAGPSTYTGEETLVGVADSWRKDIAAHMPIRVLTLAAHAHKMRENG